MQDLTLKSVLVTVFGIAYGGDHYWHEDLRPFIGKHVYAVSTLAFLGGSLSCGGGRKLVVLTHDLAPLCGAPPLRDVRDLFPPVTNPTTDALATPEASPAPAASAG